MGKKSENGPKQAERRQILKGLAASAGAVAVGAVTGLNPFETAQAAGCPGTVPKASLEYRDKPNGKDHCSVCANFVAPHCCKVVAGPIEPNGWCMAFAPQS